MVMILSRNDPYLQNDMEINQLNQLPMIPTIQNFTSAPCFMPYNVNASSHYGPPPSAQIYPNNFPSSCPPEYENKPIASEIVIISNLNADAAEFVPKQRVTGSLIGEVPPRQPGINSGQPFINSNFTNLNPLSYPPKIDYIQKNEGFEDVLPNNTLVHKVPLVQQTQYENFKQINYTHSNPNWADHALRDGPPNEDTYYQNFRETSHDKTKIERENGPHSNIKGFPTNVVKNIENFDHKETEKNHTNWPNGNQYTDQIELRQENAWYQRQITENINQKEIRPDKSNTLSNNRVDTKQGGQNTENLQYREIRYERGSSNWQDQNEFTNQIENGSTRRESTRYQRKNTENISYNRESKQDKSGTSPKLKNINNQGGQNLEKPEYGEFRFEKNWHNQTDLKHEDGSDRKDSSTRYQGKNTENIRVNRDSKQDKSGTWPTLKNINNQGGQNLEKPEYGEFRFEKNWHNQTDLKHEDGSNRKDSSTRNQGKNIDNTSQRDFWQQKRANWSNNKPARQNFENIDHKDHRPDRNINRQPEKYLQDLQQTINNVDPVITRHERSQSRRDRSDRDRQNIENSDQKESRPERTLNKGNKYNYLVEKNEMKGKLEDGQQDFRDNTKLHLDEDQNRYDKKSYVFRNQKYHNRSQRESNRDNDFSRKKKYDDENLRRNMQRKNSYFNDHKYNNPRQQKSDSQITENLSIDHTLREEEDRHRKRSGSESLESNKSDDQKPVTIKKNYRKIEEQIPESKTCCEITVWDEEKFKKEQAMRNKKHYRKEEICNNNLFEEKKKYRDLKLERDSSFNNSSLQEEENIEDLFDQNYQYEDEEYKKFLTELKSKTRRKSIRLKEVEQDLFEVPDKYSLAHCVAEDFRMGRGVAVNFKKKFKSVEDLLMQRQKPGGLAILQKKSDEGDKYIYYLVTKRRSYHKPVYKDFWKSIKRLRNHVVDHGIKFLAIPKLGCGLDKLDWPTVKHIIEFIFEKVEIEILYCRFGPNEDTPLRNYYHINVYDYNHRLVDLEEKSVILYFSTVDGEITDEMKEFDEKFKFLDTFKSTPKTPGAVLKHTTDIHLICGCIARNTTRDLFDFKSFRKCIDEINNVTKTGDYTGLAMNQIWDTRDRLLHHKVVTMLIHYLKNIDVYVYKEEADESIDET